MAQTPETGHAASGRWTKFDVVWMLNLFGTAVGAGILFLPINAGMSGIWPLGVITLLVGPMTYFAHRGLARFVLSSSRADSDITAVVEEHFGLSAGKLITLLYFFAIYPILLIYAVGNTTGGVKGRINVGCGQGVGWTITGGRLVGPIVSALEPQA